MQLSDRLSGLLAMALGLAVVLYARTLPPMPGQDIGPSLFPTLIGSGLVGFGAWIAFAGLRVRDREPWIGFDAWTRRPRMVVNALLVVVAMVAFIVVVTPLGFFLTSTVFLAGLTVAFGGSRVWAIPAALLVTLVIHYAFYSLLRVPLPWGVLQGMAW